MKVYMFQDMNISKQTVTTGSYNRSYDHHRSGANALTINSDSIEISAEARRLYEESRVVEFEIARLKKQAREYLPMVRRILDAGDTERTGVFRIEKVHALRQAVSGSVYDFDDAAHIESAAGEVMGFLL
jgi:hypothetical protein